MLKNFLSRKLFLVFNFLLLIQFVIAQPKLDWVNKVGTTSTPPSKKIYSVNKYGAKANDTATLSTNAIQKAIDECSSKGGGIVTLEPGVYKTGSLFIKSNVHFRIDKDVEIIGSQNFDDYPEIDTRIAGIEMKWPAALFNIIGQNNAMISGDGNVNARGKFCWDKYRTMRTDYDKRGLRWIVDYDCKRIRTLLVQSSSNITIKNIRFANAGFWTVQLLYSHHLTIDGIVVRNNEDGKGPSTDGIDVDSSSWVLIENCDIDCNEDDICLKSGRDWDGLRVNKPTEYVVIRKCIARKGGGLLTLGSETSGGIHHVLAENLQGKGTGNGLHIKSATTRGGLIEDIHFRNIQLDSVTTAFQFTMNWNPAYSYSTLPKGYSYDSIPAHWKTMLHKVEPVEKGIPQFKNIFVSNITAAGVKKVMNAVGLKESSLINFQFSTLNIGGNVAGDISFADGWQFKNVTIKAADNKPLNVLNSNNMNINQ